MSTSDDAIVQIDFKGLRTDRGQKFIGPEYFYNSINFNFDDIVGANKILMPSIIYNGASSTDIDGLFEFTYLDENSISQDLSVAVYNGGFYKNWISGSPTLVQSGLSPGKTRFAVLNNLLYFVNGIDYPKVYNGLFVREMGAPGATDSAVSGNPNGTYYYEMTFVTASGEERIGTRSNTITVINSSISLTLPIGYSGTTGRKIYRTTNGGSTPKLVATISDNDTLTYLDNTADGSLGADIIAINNECPKPRFIETAYLQLVGAVVDLYPTQAFVSDTNVEVWDLALFVEVSGIGNDSSPLVGMSQDYSLIIMGSEKNIYTMDVSSSPSAVTATRANIGVGNGYSMFTVPAMGDFDGGVMFLSTIDDIRLFNGNISQPVATSLDNLKTDNLSQPIIKIIQYYVRPQSNIYAQYFNYKYHLIVDNILLVFDIRLQAWTVYKIITDSYAPSYNVMAVLNNQLYAGQVGSQIIEQFYASIKYRDEDATAVLESGQLKAGDTVFYYKDFYLYYVSSARDVVTVEIVFDSESDLPVTYEVEIIGGSFDQSFYSQEDYSGSKDQEDYKVIHLNRWARWIQYKITASSGRIFFRGFKIDFDNVANKE